MLGEIFMYTYNDIIYLYVYAEYDDFSLLFASSILAVKTLEDIISEVDRLFSRSSSYF